MGPVAPPLLTIPPGGAALDSAIQCGPAAQAAERKRAEAARLKEEEKLRKREEAELAKRQLAEAEAERRRVEQVRHRWPIAHSLALRPQSALPDVAIISVGPFTAGGEGAEGPRAEGEKGGEARNSVGQEG